MAMQNIKSLNSSKSEMLYLALGYEERVEEVFESRVTRWSPWMDDSGRGKVRNARLGVWTRGQMLDCAVTGARTHGDNRADAQVDARHVTGACVHACTRKNVRGSRRVQGLSRGD
ncbi:hypothetical protein CRG98_018675 [Punica granatum]|uniref:Uncharacterized protein n=1 Tax=Punica granatum TaxID=22663 RepID=A0A2I0JX90_PUNGR|nr:hypothetical protein CRG98_018675 [Punica granatum]